VDEIVLVPDAEGILALSFWKTREHAERYSHDDYAKVSDIIQHFNRNTTRQYLGQTP
jgi:hypothetical protein